MSDCLVLNSNYEPLSVLPISTCNWQTAVKLTYLNRFTVHTWYDDWHVRSQRVSMPVPAIIVSKRYYKNTEGVKYNRRNLFLRDLFTCQYCGDIFASKDLTIDHVIPKSMGGGGGWTNTVTACKECNREKGAKLVTPLRPPQRPSYWNLAGNIKIPAQMIRHPSWYTFLPVETEQVA